MVSPSAAQRDAECHSAPAAVSGHPGDGAADTGAGGTTPHRLADGGWQRAVTRTTASSQPGKGARSADEGHHLQVRTLIRALLSQVVVFAVTAIALRLGANAATVGFGFFI